MKTFLRFVFKCLTFTFSCFIARKLWVWTCWLVWASLCVMCSSWYSQAHVFKLITVVSPMQCPNLFTTLCMSDVGGKKQQFDTKCWASIHDFNECFFYTQSWHSHVPPKFSVSATGTFYFSLQSCFKMAALVVGVYRLRLRSALIGNNAWKHRGSF